MKSANHLNVSIFLLRSKMIRLECILHLCFLMCFHLSPKPSHNNPPSQSGFCYCHHISKLLLLLSSHVSPTIIFIANIFTNVWHLWLSTTTHFCFIDVFFIRWNGWTYWNATLVICGPNTTTIISPGTVKLWLKNKFNNKLPSKVWQSQKGNKFYISMFS